MKRLAHFEPAGVDGRSFFSGEGGLQMELGFLFTVKRGDVDSLQSPVIVSTLSTGNEELHVAVKEPYHTFRSVDTRWRRRSEDIACAIPDI